MRLSDAIALGRTLVTNPCVGGTGRIDKPAEPGDGCALDMAVLAIDGKGIWTDAAYIWPWLNYNEQGKLKKGCSSSYLYRIAVSFDVEVLIMKIKTLDQLIDWVRSVEPAEEIPVDTAPMEEVEYASMT